MRKISLKEAVACLGWQSWDSSSGILNPVGVLATTVASGEHSVPPVSLALESGRFAVLGPQDVQLLLWSNLECFFLF